MSGAPAGLQAEMTLPAGYRLLAYDSVGSTMEEARLLAEAGAPDGTLVWAREQTAGRGRQGRGFLSPRGNLFVTFLLRPRGPLLASAQLGFVLGVALVEAVAATTPLAGRARLKWPNDLLLDGAKSAGLLLESRLLGAELDWLLIGLGVNLVAAPAAGETPYRATSLAAAGGVALRPEQLLEPLAARFAAWRRVLETQGFAPLRRAWLSHAAGLGQPVTARLPRGTEEGLFLDLDEDGALLLQGADGRTRSITVADVFFA